MLDAFQPLCMVLYEQVKMFFPNLHGHQCKVFAMFVWGAIKGQSIVVQRVAEELLSESHATCESIERRLRRFLSNERIAVKETWNHVLRHVLPYWKGKKVYLVLDLTTLEDHAQLVYVGLIQQTRVLPLAWEVMPGQEKWDEKLWDVVERLFQQIGTSLHAQECTLIADQGLSHLPLIHLCQQQGWHYLLRISQDEWVRCAFQHFYRDWVQVSDLVGEVGMHWSGKVLLWKDHQWETQLTAIWEAGHEQAWFLISDLPAGAGRILHYRWRMRVESMFQDMKSRGWQWESTLLHKRERLDRLLLILFFCFWWLMHLAASCIHNGRRTRYDRHDRRDKGHLRIGRLYLLDIVRKKPPLALLKECLLFRRRRHQWVFSLRF